MPHLIYEYTDNLSDQDIQGLVDKSAQVIIAQGGVFPTGGIRVRAHCVREYTIADGAGQNREPSDAFVHAHLKIGRGRTPAQLQKVCDDLFALMSAHFAEASKQRGLALSLEYSEFGNGTWKQNNLHERYR